MEAPHLLKYPYAGSFPHQQQGIGRPANFVPAPLNAAPLHLAGRKRDAMGAPIPEPGSLPFKPQETFDGGSFAKLFVGSVPKTVTEEEVRPMFAKHGDVLEIAILRDKKTGQQQGCCFIKFKTIEEAERAIKAIHNQQTLPGGTAPVQVRFADGERERLGALEHKLFVGCVNRQANEEEIEEIFAQYGRVDDVYIMRDEAKQSRGCAFVKYPTREMAIAAINALNNSYTMRGCDQPLTVRFAEPKRLRSGGDTSRVGGAGFGPSSFIPRPGLSPSGPRADLRPASHIGGRGPPLGWHHSGMPGMRPGVQAASSLYDMQPALRVPSAVDAILGSSPVAANVHPQGVNMPGSSINVASQGMIAASSHYQGLFKASTREATPYGQQTQPYLQQSATQPHQESLYSQQGSAKQQHIHQQIAGGALMISPHQAAYGLVPPMHQVATGFGQQLINPQAQSQQTQPQFLSSGQQNQVPVSGVAMLQSMPQQVVMHSVRQQLIPQPLPSETLVQASHQRPMVHAIQQVQSLGVSFQHSSQPSTVPVSSQLYGVQSITPQALVQSGQAQVPAAQGQRPQQLVPQPWQTQQQKVYPFERQQQQVQPLQLQAPQLQVQPSQAQQQSPQQQQQAHTQPQQVYYQQMSSLQQPLQQHAVLAQQPQASSTVSPAHAASTATWTEHTSPEGYKYYYNSTTGESKWEKPQELIHIEKQQQPQQQQQQQQQQQSSVANSQQYAGGAVAVSQFSTQGLTSGQIQPISGALDQNKQLAAIAQQDWTWKGRASGT